MNGRRTRSGQDRPADSGRQVGRPAAERALGQIRLVAVAILLVAGAGYRPEEGAVAGRTLVLVLAGAAAAVLLLIFFVCGRASKARAGRRTALALTGTVVDTVVVLGAIGLTGLPPQSFSLVLLMLPLLEGALWFGLVGLGALWTLASVALGVFIVSCPALVPKEALGTLIVAMPTLLLAVIPVAILAEHLVAQVGGLAAAREAADDRARLLGDLSAITAEILPLDADAVLGQLVAGAQQLGARDVSITDPAGGQQVPPGAPAAAGAWTRTPAPEDVPDDLHRTAVTRELALPDGAPVTFTATVTGTADELARLTEALDLLVAQARVALANAVLVRQLEHLKQTYQELATRDQLTGLLNRRGLVLRAEQMPGGLGVLFCDLDGFKGVNDNLGHAAGDQLLEQVARRLERELPSAAVLGRMGGDEFVAVVPGATDKNLAHLASRVELGLGRPFLLDDGMARIGVSVGIARAGAGERDLGVLLDEADRLMYEVKRARKADGAGRRESGVLA